MHNIIFPLKDTTIYSKYPEVNTGLDEILEISKEISSSNYIYRGAWAAGTYYKKRDYVSGSVAAGLTGGYYYALAENIGENPTGSYWQQIGASADANNSRVLIKFDLSNLTTEASASASAGVVYLNLYTSIAKKVPIEYTLNAHPMETDWEMGIGNFTDKLTTDGATWIRSSSIGEWAAEGAEGNYSPSVEASQTFNFAPTDVRMDITNIFNYWTSSVNNGIIIKRPDDEETNRTKYGSLSFYSLDTHTVYVPTLEIAYDDHVYDTSEFLVWNLKVYSTTSTSSLNIDSASFKFNTISATTMSVETGSKEFVVGTSLDYSVGIPLYITASVSSSVIMTGTVSGYDSASGAITASILTKAGPTGSYENWYVNTPAGYTLGTGYRNQYFTVDPQLPYTVGQTFVMTASAGNYMNGTVVDYNLTSGSMTASITYATGSGSSSLWNVELAAGEDPGYSVTGSVSGSLISGSVSVYMKNFLPTYQYNETTRFRVTVKKAYQAKTFYEEARTGETFYLPSGSLKYSIRDAYSNRVMIPFSDYTKVSLDSTGHFFDVSLSGFMPERFYKVIFKYTENGVDQYIDKNSQFKVVK